MSSTLKAAFALTGLIVGVPVVTSHGLNWSGRAVVPDFIALTNSPFTVTANATTITITRILGAPDNVEVLAESWHTIERAFGSSSITALTSQPFVVQGRAG